MLARVAESSLHRASTFMSNEVLEKILSRIEALEKAVAKLLTKAAARKKR